MCVVDETHPRRRKQRMNFLLRVFFNRFGRISTQVRAVWHRWWFSILKDRGIGKLSWAGKSFFFVPVKSGGQGGLRVGKAMGTNLVFHWRINFGKMAGSNCKPPCPPLFTGTKKTSFAAQLNFPMPGSFRKQKPPANVPDPAPTCVEIRPKTIEENPQQKIHSLLSAARWVPSTTHTDCSFVPGAAPLAGLTPCRPDFPQWESAAFPAGFSVCAGRCGGTG